MVYLYYYVFNRKQLQKEPTDTNNKVKEVLQSH